MPAYGRIQPHAAAAFTPYYISPFRQGLMYASHRVSFFLPYIIFVFAELHFIFLRLFKIDLCALPPQYCTTFLFIDTLWGFVIYSGHISLYSFEAWIFWFCFINARSCPRDESSFHVDSFATLLFEKACLTSAYAFDIIIISTTMNFGQHSRYFPYSLPLVSRWPFPLFNIT